MHLWVHWLGQTTGTYSGVMAWAWRYPNYLGCLTRRDACRMLQHPSKQVLGPLQPQWGEPKQSCGLGPDFSHRCYPENVTGTAARRRAPSRSGRR